jgi:hypothetical protein
MKTLNNSLLVLVSVFLSFASTQYSHAECRINSATYRGWNGFKLANELVTLYVVPDIGGRVIQFQLAEHTYFFVNDELAGKVFAPEENGGPKGGWKNYGGDKLWPAPQGWENDEQWPGPPDPVLDGGKYEGKIVERRPEHVALGLISPPDQRTGIQFSRTIHLFPGSTQVRVESAMKNISQRPVRWAIWEVMQHDTADPNDPQRINEDFWAYCPLNPRSLHPKGFYPMFGQATHPSYRPDYATGILGVKYDYRVGKVGLDSNGGWLAVVNGKSDHCLVQKFAFYPNATYPDHASVEFWLNGAGEFIINGMAITNLAGPRQTPYLMETEILSPLIELQPGQDYRFQVDWFATRCSKPVMGVTSAGAISRPLSASVQNGHVNLEGVFGVFYIGHAEAVFKAADGADLGRVDLGRVDPNHVFRLSRKILLPDKTFRITVNLLDEKGHRRGSLGNVVVFP